MSGQVRGRGGGDGMMGLGSLMYEDNKCSARSMEVKLPALLGNYDGQTGS